MGQELLTVATEKQPSQQTTVPERSSTCISAISNWHHVVTFLEKSMWIVVAVHGHVDDFCQEVAGNDSWIDPHNFKWGFTQPFSVEVEFQSVFNCVCFSRS